jgi:heme O synthase-like polyprenyltransferase
LVAGFAFDTFLAAAGFFVAVGLAFFVVVAFLAFGLAAFFGDEAFLTPAGLAAVDFFALAKDKQNKFSEKINFFSIFYLVLVFLLLLLI